MKRAEMKTVMDGDQKSGRFLEALHHEKHDRLARNALQDMLAFHEELEAEIVRFSDPACTSGMEQEVLHRMIQVRECYHEVMQGFLRQETEAQQHVLVRFSDALLDLMKLVNRYKVQ